MCQVFSNEKCCFYSSTWYFYNKMDLLLSLKQNLISSELLHPSVCLMTTNMWLAMRTMLSLKAVSAISRTCRMDRPYLFFFEICEIFVSLQIEIQNNI